MAYGLVTPADGRALERSIERVAQRFPGEEVHIVEIGVCHGDTSRALKAFMEAAGIRFRYTGIDNDRDLAVQPPFDGARLLKGSSAEVYIELERERVHWVFVDGCHAANAVMLDFLNFGDLLVPGGELVMHDASPLAQGKLDWQGVGPKNHPDFGTATRTACRRLGLLGESRIDWLLREQTWDEGVDWGGTIVLEKLIDATDSFMATARITP